MKKRYAVFAVLVLAATPAVAKAIKIGQKFHSPKTDAERALDHILQVKNSDGHLLDFLLPDSSASEDQSKSISMLFTRQLMQAWKKSYDSLPEEDGGWKFVDVDWIRCEQDFPDRYLYITVRSNDYEAYIDTIWSIDVDHPPPLRSPYRMVKEEGTWKLDGVDCGDKVNRFNMQ